MGGLIFEEEAFSWAIPVKKLIWKPAVRTWCAFTYPDHPQGCPNYRPGKCDPDRELWINDLLMVQKPMWLVYSEFNLEAHAQRMKEEHSDWTERQCRNLLYWQPTSKRQMRQRTELFISVTPGADYPVYLPEYYGVNVYATAALSGLELEPIKGLKICHHIALVGKRKER